MKKKSNKKKKLVAAALLALLACGAGTFAWLTSSQERLNRVSSQKLEDNAVQLNEEWAPIDIVPGTKTTKKVTVTNTGTAPAFVRVSFEEVLKHLKDEGKITYKNKGYVSGDTDLPVQNAAINTTEWQEVPHDKIKIMNGQTSVEVPTNLKIYGKGKTYFDNTTQLYNSSAGYKAVFEYATGKLQTVTIPIPVLTNPDQSLNAWEHEIQFKETDIAYNVYKDGYTYKAVNWAKSYSAAADNTFAPGAMLIGTAGTKDNNDYDYTQATLGLQSIVPTPSAETFTAGATVPVQADQFFEALNGVANTKGIKIKYGTAISSTSAIADNTWVYNKDDGFFYYSTLLTGSKTTSSLMDELIFDTGMKDLLAAYTNSTYDLIVKMEAIQGTKEAITGENADDLGWSLNELAGTSTDTNNIMNHLLDQLDK